MNLEKIDAVSFGRSLTGFGVNLLVREMARSILFLEQVLGFRAVRQSEDYAILVFPAAAGGSSAQQQLLQLHADHTYGSNPLPSLLPESGARGGGLELRLYDVDPDAAEARAKVANAMILQSCANKPHGLRECFLLDPDGYCWVPSRPLGEEEE